MKLEPRILNYVKKLDDKPTYDAIVTNITDYNDLPTVNVKNIYRTLYNYSNNFKLCDSQDTFNNILWIGDCFDKLKTFIQTNAGYKKDSSLRFQYEAIAWILLSIDKIKHKENSRWFWNEGLRIQTKINIDRDNNIMGVDQLCNYEPYTELQRVQRSLYETWLLDPNSQYKNTRALILALNVLVPPLRKNYHDMIIWRKSEPPPKNDNNYLWEEFPKRWTYVINYDKVENKRRAKNLPRQTFAIDDEISGVTNGKMLNNIINKSLIYYPREYLLTGTCKTGSPMSSHMYGFTISKIFKKNVSQNLIRKAYINHFYDKHSICIKREIAKRMRHSVEVAEQSYRKINVPTNINDKTETIEYKDGLKRIHITITVRIDDLEE